MSTLLSKFVIDRTTNVEQTAPFLIRTFIKVGTFHRLAQFEDGTVPTADEQQIFTWYVSACHGTCILK